MVEELITRSTVRDERTSSPLTIVTVGMRST